jgi:hypothetical protein
MASKAPLLAPREATKQDARQTVQRRASRSCPLTTTSNPPTAPRRMDTSSATRAAAAAAAPSSRAAPPAAQPALLATLSLPVAVSPCRPLPDAAVAISLVQLPGALAGLAAAWRRKCRVNHSCMIAITSCMTLPRPAQSAHSCITSIRPTHPHTTRRPTRRRSADRRLLHGRKSSVRQRLL